MKFVAGVVAMSRDVEMGLPREGMDLVSSEESLREGAYRKLRNVDLSKEGIVRRRLGYKKHMAIEGAHSLYSAFGFLFLVYKGELLRFAVGERDGHVVGAVGDLPCSYTEYNGVLYISNSLGVWRYNEGFLVSVGVRNTYSGGVPFSQGGTKKQLTHRVHIAVSCVEGGEESGAVVVGESDLELLPEHGDLGSLRVYATAGAGGSWVLVGSVEPCEVLGLEPLPGGHYIVGHRGRLVVAMDNCIAFSEALRPHLYDPASNIIPFVGRIRALLSIRECLYIADDRGIWALVGKDIEEASLEHASSAIIVDGSALAVDSGMLPTEREDMDISEGETLAVFLTEYGYIGGRANGELVNLSRGFVKLPAGRQGCTFALERNGMAQLVSAINAISLEAVGLTKDSIF